MNLLVDTSIWSLALRKSKITYTPQQLAVLEAFKEFIKDSRVKIIGPIRQKILSGIKEQKNFEQLKEILKYYKDEELLTEDFEQAARLFNLCRENGIQGSHTDFLICALAKRKKYIIFTLDNDFENFQIVIDIKIYSLPNGDN